MGDTEKHLCPETSQGPAWYQYRHRRYKGKEITACPSESIWICLTPKPVFFGSALPPSVLPLILQFKVYSRYPFNPCLPTIHPLSPTTHTGLTFAVHGASGRCQTFPAHCSVIASHTDTWNALWPHFHLMKFCLKEHLFIEAVPSAWSYQIHLLGGPTVLCPREKFAVCGFFSSFKETLEDC